MVPNRKVKYPPACEREIKRGLRFTFSSDLWKCEPLIWPKSPMHIEECGTVENFCAQISCSTVGGAAAEKKAHFSRIRNNVPILQNSHSSDGLNFVTIQNEYY